MTSKCPTEDTLRNWVLGDLPDADGDDIADHLDACPNCEQRIDKISRRNAMVVSSGEQKFHSEPECRDMVDGLIAATFLDAAALSGSADAVSFQHSEIRDYQLRDVLGRGGMGVVYRARHTRLNKDVALKVLSDRAIRNPQTVRRFEREMQIVGQLEHPNIVRALDAGEFNGIYFLVMELVEGADLAQLTAQQTTLKVADACEVIRQAAIGLQYAHDLGLIHRDVKPANLMLTCDVDGKAVVKVMDLGLALATEGAAVNPLTDQGQLMGTLEFMAPEQSIGTSPVDHRADIYALGATLYRLLTGTVPFGGPTFNTPARRLFGMTNQAAPSVSTRMANLPKRLSEIVDGMLSTEQAERPQSMSSVAELLQPFAHEHDLSTLCQTAITLSTRSNQTTPDAIPLNDTSPTAGPTFVERGDETIGGSMTDHDISSPKFGRRWAGAALSLLVLLGIIWLKKTDGGYLRIEADPAIDVTVDVLNDGKKNQVN